MSVPKLSEAAIDAALEALPGWSVQDGKLHHEYKFANFVRAFGFMTMSAIEIEKKNHHPEWFNVYGRVTVDLVTHDSGGITQKDVDLAKKLNEIAATLA